MADHADGPAMMGESRNSNGEITVARVARQRILFERFAWFALAYTTLTILFGSFVRASLSGDGCGTSWPLCGGSLLPPSDAALKTYIELTHRVTSGITLLIVAALYIGARLIFPAGAAARKASGLSVIFTIVSALIGAVLVLFGLVVHDKSVARAITMPLHLVNTLLLLGNLWVAAVMARSEEKLTWKAAGSVGNAIKASMGGMFVLGVTGAISAMGKTAFSPEMAEATSFVERMQLHLGPDAHPLLRGGISHPLVATSVAILIMWTCHYAAEKHPSPKVVEWSRICSGLLVIQFVFGLANLMMSAPPAMQILHLLLAIGNWLSLVMLAIQVLRESPDVIHDKEAASPKEKVPFMHLVKDYVALTKPRVISLLLFTTVAAMVIARGTWPEWWLILAVSVAGYMVAGSANTWNMIVEQDLDLAMERTSTRPIVGGRITVGQAAIFATTLAVGSFVILAWTANVLSALLAWAGLAFYVLIYTLVLKRRTWQNIVIGGAAGAFPPLVGYTAVTNELSGFAWFMFWLIVLWTPVHFWALALLIKDDYAKAGVPMLPVVKGERATVIQIAFYAGLTALVSSIPLVLREVGLIYMIGAGLLNLLLLVQSFQLLRHTDRPNARALFKYSMVYLALMFVVIAVDRGVDGPIKKGIHLQTLSTTIAEDVR